MEKHNEIRFKLSFDEMFTLSVSRALKDLGFEPSRNILVVKTDPFKQNLIVSRRMQMPDGRQTFMLTFSGKRLNVDHGRGCLEYQEDYIVLDYPLDWIFSEFFMEMMKKVGYIPGDYCIFETGYTNTDIKIQLCQTLKSGKNCLRIIIPEKEE